MDYDPDVQDEVEAITGTKNVPAFTTNRLGGNQLFNKTPESTIFR